jgi:hypothetical protein
LGQIPQNVGSGSRAGAAPALFHEAAIRAAARHQGRRIPGPIPYFFPGFYLISVSSKVNRILHIQSGLNGSKKILSMKKSQST